MREMTGNIWDNHRPVPGHILAITTNGLVNKDNHAIMGRGVALEAKQRFPWVPEVLGRMLINNGNHVHYLGSNLISFPTKNDWRHKSDIELITQSCRELMTLKSLYRWHWVILPRPGCENGGLTWEEVRIIISTILDDSIYIISKGGGL